MGLSLKQFFRPSHFKRDRKTVRVNGDEFREAQQAQAVRDFLEETNAREKRLREEGLIQS